MARSNVCLAALATVTIVFALTPGNLPAQTEDSGSPVAKPDPLELDMPIALLDVGHVFKNHKGFERQMAQMKKDLEETEARFRLETAKIQVFEEKLKKVVAGSDEFFDLEKKIIADRTTLQTKMATEKQQYMRREAGVYADVYKEIKAAVGDYSRENGIRLVIRYNREPMNVADPNSVMKSVNRNIIFQDGLDISEEILRRTNADEPPEVDGI